MSCLKKLLFIYLAIVITKAALSYFIPAPSAFSDEYAYAKLAQSFFENGAFEIHNIPSMRYLPLYPILLAISYAFNSMTIVYIAMKVINVLLSTLIIFPVFYLAKEFLVEKRAFFAALLVGLMPMNFAISPYLLSENIFYPLFAAAFYLIYKMFTSDKLKWAILAGVCVGLAYLVKINGLILIAPVLAYSLICLLKNKGQFLVIAKKISIFLSVLLIVVLPWLIRTASLFGFSFSGLLGAYSSQSAGVLLNSVQLSAFITWIVLYTGYVIIASGFLLFFNSLFITQETAQKKAFCWLLWLCAFFVIALAAYHNLAAYRNFDYIMYETPLNWLSGRPIGRYVDFILPIFIIGGFIGKGGKSKKGTVIKFAFAGLVLIFSSLLAFFPLFPVNNLNLAWLGAVSHILTSLIKSDYLLLALFSFLFLSLFLIAIKIKFKTFIKLLFILFIATSMLDYGLTYYNSKTFWYEGEQMQAGLWLSKNIPKDAKILIDERYEGKIEKQNQTALYEHTASGSYSTIFGFWVRNEIGFGSLDNEGDFDYFVTRDEIKEYKLVEKIGSIKVYKPS